MAESQTVDDKSVVDKILAAVTGFGDQLVAVGNRLAKIEARHDAEEKEKEEDKEKKEREDSARRDAAKRDAWKQFSSRRHDESDDAFKKRHDDEECSLLERFLAMGEPREVAAESAKKGRRDAERTMADSKHFSHDRSRRDAEEKELAEKFEKEAKEPRDDAIRRAHDARTRRDEEDKEKEEREEKDRKERDDKDRKDKQDRQDRQDAHVNIPDMIKKEIDKLKPVEVSEADRAKLATAQAEADHVAQAFGDHAPRPLQGELLREYLVRISTKYKNHSPVWKNADLNLLPMDVLVIAKDAIYADAQKASRMPDPTTGMLRPIVRKDAANREITEFVGEPISWMSAFMLPRRAVTKIVVPDRR